MDSKGTLIALLLAGFFAVGCLRAREPAVAGVLTSGDLFRLPGRWERLRRSRWQWFSMVGIMLVLRLQQQLPAAIEVMVAVEFGLFLAIPTGAPAVGRRP
ncbi:MAG TPA: hypothetical protein VN848_03330 [Gemmatimonadales bacterium]|nr:hypothetical protein [Gemmatimonadales bacterium]